MMNDNTREQLKQFVERIENLEAEKAQAGEQIKSAYTDAAAAGFDKKALRQIMKRRRADMHKSVRLRAETDLYMRAIADFDDTELGQWARDWQAQQRAAESIAEPKATSYAEATAKGRSRDRSDLN
tara:strand:- start:10656 stop:11033 length:378 start_codon:yes stop_codon:yes gene_type:complete